MRFIDLEEVKFITGLSKTQVYRLIQRGDFPPQIKLGSSSRWLLSSVENWMMKKTTNENQPVCIL